MSYRGAAEQKPADVASLELPDAERYAKVLFARLSHLTPLPVRASVLDVGAAQGLFLMACARLGHHAVGVEPWAEARENALRISRGIGVDIQMLEGTAEHLPLADATFDVVRANSVVEHVEDASAAFKEAYRVLKPGGVFWFLTASSLCPAQGEIRGFPAFGWYPGFLKLKIMRWALTNRPDLIGHTSAPAYHWFTPRKARRMLKEAGFSRVFDRWDIRLPSEGGPLYRASLKAIRLNFGTKFLADVLVPCCSYAAMKTAPWGPARLI